MSTQPTINGRKLGLALSLLAGAVLFAAMPAAAGGPGPDVTVFAFTDIGNYGSTGGFAGYSLGTRSCNRGDAPLNWCDNNGGCGAGTTDEDHPVIAQNLYRLKNDRFEQIGMSWLKHGFLSTNSTTGGCTGAQGQSCTGPPLGNNQLGIGCTDPYGSGLNGSRPLGMRSEVNSSTGVFPFPYSAVGGPYAVYDQRIKVAVADVDPALNAGASYYVEGHYIAADDAAAGNSLNNASHRLVTVGGGPTFALSQSGTFMEGDPAIFAWEAADPSVERIAVDIPGSTPTERFHVARKVTDLGGGTWHYEYALYNMNSDRSAYTFTVDFPGTPPITTPGYHDVKHHSGEPYDTTDWGVSIDGGNGSITWATDDFATDADANALRWGTLFNFWFDAEADPTGVDHSLGLFKPGSPGSVDFSFAGPPAPFFADGFESGNTSSWSLVAGE